MWFVHVVVLLHLSVQQSLQVSLVPSEVAFDQDEMKGCILRSPKKTPHIYTAEVHTYKPVVSVCIVEISVLALVVIPVD